LKQLCNAETLYWMKETKPTKRLLGMAANRYCQYLKTAIHTNEDQL